MVNINWEEISGRDFEKIIFHLLGKLGFKNRIWYGKGGSDKGRDIIAYTIEDLPFGFEFQRKWVVQCKKWKSFPPKNIIAQEIASAIEHNPDFWLLATCSQPSSNIIDYLEAMDKKHNFKILTLTKIHIEELLYKFDHVLFEIENFEGEIEMNSEIIKINSDIELIYKERDIIELTKEDEKEIVNSNMPSNPEISPDRCEIAYISPYAWEQIGELYIYNINNNKNKLVLSENILPSQNTVKEVVWINNDYLLLIIGFAYGTVSVGGDIYIYNTLNEKLNKYKETGKNQEYKNIKVKELGKTVTVDIVTFDDNYINYDEREIEINYNDLI